MAVWAVDGPWQTSRRIPVHLYTPLKPLLED